MDAETKLSGLGSTVRAIQRELTGQARADRHLAELQPGAVIGQAEETAEESKQQLSPRGSGGKQEGAGQGWVGKGELERKQLQFGEGHEGGGAGQRETEKEQEQDDFMKELDAVLAAYEKDDEQAAAMRAEKEQEHEQAAARRAEEDRLWRQRLRLRRWQQLDMRERKRRGVCAG